ncbi:MAG TPA: DUF6794 domain-containing protein, partial [Polyangiaceae bacterium]
SESKPGGGGGGSQTLQAARWNGTAWLSLGILDADVNRPAPSLAVDSSGTPWVAWIRDGLHVARGAGNVWTEAPVPAGTRGRGPHLVIEPGGTAFVSWTATAASGKPDDATIAAARTNGTDWNVVSPPTSHGVRYSALQLVDGTPVAAWSEGGRGEIASAQVSRFVGGRWVDLFRGMQADTGQSDVGVVALAPSDKGFYLAWDEVGDDHVRARVLEAKPCAASEKPDAIPASKPRASFWPKTVDEAVTQILSTMDDASKKRVRDTPRGDLIQFHHSWGMGIRNSMGLWQGNDALLASCHTTDPDACSGVIIEKTWERLQISSAPAPHP